MASEPSLTPITPRTPLLDNNAHSFVDFSLPSVPSSNIGLAAQITGVLTPSVSSTRSSSPDPLRLAKKKAEDIYSMLCRHAGDFYILKRDSLSIAERQFPIDMTLPSNSSAQMIVTYDKIQKAHRDFIGAASEDILRIISESAHKKIADMQSTCQKILDTQSAQSRKKVSSDVQTTLVTYAFVREKLDLEAVELFIAKDVNADTLRPLKMNAANTHKLYRELLSSAKRASAPACLLGSKKTSVVATGTTTTPATPEKKPKKLPLIYRISDAISNAFSPSSEGVWS